MSETKSSAPDARHAKAIETAQKLRAHLTHSHLRTVSLFDLALAAFNEQYPYSTDYPLWHRMEISISDKITQTRLFEEEQRHYNAIFEAGKRLGAETARSTAPVPAAPAASVIDEIRAADLTLTRKRTDARVTYARTIANAEAACAMAMFGSVLADVERAEHAND